MPVSLPRYRKGDRIAGRYLVHQALQGGMGEVYLCLDLEENEPGALKTFQQRYLTTPDIRRLFEEEVRTWVALEKHPNIVCCFWMQMLDNQPFMLLEWVAGEERRGTDLRSWLRHGPLDLRLTLDFIIDICRGLMHAQAKQPGIVHRDLKPDNILVSQGRLAKITDFGLALVAQRAHLELGGDSEPDADSHQHTRRAGNVVGTPPYTNLTSGMQKEMW
jgi:serine/threonine protein kinase